MFSHVATHLDNNYILTFKQHGFRPGFSCETQLVSAIHDWAQTLEDRGQTDLALLDFSKAFDRVPHERLMLKLLDGKTARWIKAFLSKRMQSVVVNGQSSAPQPVTSGVPQGSVLGPLLFLIFINDISQDLQSDIRLVADDSILYRQIKSNEDHIIMQNDLSKLHSWSKTWQMDLNVTKCAIMSVTHKRTPSSFDYTMDNQTVTRIGPDESADYLGVSINNKLTWNNHCTKVSSKASQTLGMLRRNISSCPTSVKAQAYQTLVRPKLEYASSAWSPHTNNDSKQIEAVQNAAARFCTRDYQRTSSVSGMVSDLGWDSLRIRRLLHDVTLFYKIQREFVRIPFPAQVTPAPLQSTRSSHTFKKQVTYASIAAYKHSFFIRTIPVWNGLPGSAVVAPSVGMFQAAALPTLRAM